MESKESIQAIDSELERIARIKQTSEYTSDLENSIKRGLKRAMEMDDKYFNLVSLARTDKGHDSRFEKIRLKHECSKYGNIDEEIEKLADPETGDWQHGFNSGCLAMARLLSSYFTSRILAREEQAKMFRNSELEGYGNYEDAIENSSDPYDCLEDELAFAEESFPNLDT